MIAASTPSRQCQPRRTKIAHEAGLQVYGVDVDTYRLEGCSHGADASVVNARFNIPRQPFLAVVAFCGTSASYGVQAVVDPSLNRPGGCDSHDFFSSSSTMTTMSLRSQVKVSSAVMKVLKPFSGMGSSQRKSSRERSASANR